MQILNALISLATFLGLEAAIHQGCTVPQQLQAVGTTSRGPFRTGTRASIFCVGGGITVNNRRVRNVEVVCQADGSWLSPGLGTVTAAVLSRLCPTSNGCMVPPELEPIGTTSRGPFHAHTMAQVTCAGGGGIVVGGRRMRSVFVTCQADGKWAAQGLGTVTAAALRTLCPNSNAPVSNGCTVPPQLDPVGTRSRGPFPTNTKARVTCAGGGGIVVHGRRVASVEVTCQADGTWYAAGLGTVTAAALRSLCPTSVRSNGCTVPPQLKAIGTTSRGPFPTDTVARVECVGGGVIVGGRRVRDTEVTCRADGTWFATGLGAVTLAVLRSLCPNDQSSSGCTVPPQLQAVGTMSRGPFPTGTRARVACVGGGITVGGRRLNNVEVECRGDGTWFALGIGTISSAVLQSLCPTNEAPSGCTVPQQLQAIGTLSRGPFSTGTEARVACVGGEITVGGRRVSSVSVTCQTDGTWSAAGLGTVTASALRTLCPNQSSSGCTVPPQLQPIGTRSRGPFSAGTVARVACAGGGIIAGGRRVNNVEVSCQADGTWSARGLGTITAATLQSLCPTY